MQVIHRACAGMDVHKDSVVVCVRKMTGKKIERGAGREPFGEDHARAIRPPRSDRRDRREQNADGTESRVRRRESEASCWVLDAAYSLLVSLQTQ